MLLDRRLIEEIQTSRVRASFNRLAFGKFLIICWGIAWNIFVVRLLKHFWREPVFDVAAILSMLFTIFSIAGYTTQFFLIQKINMAASILETQTQLAQLERLIIRTYRILILQTPLYTFFFLSGDLMKKMTLAAWIWQGSITGLVILGSVWVYRKISYDNKDKKWVRSLLNNEGGKSIARARQFIKEIEEWKEE